ncbi:MAG: YqgE/AlgH family protein [Acidimicrobiia bacterium]
MTLRGRLLVATPLLADPNFVRTVVLVLDHGDEGALGVVLNRATDTLVAEAIEPWAGMASVPAVVFLGGPVGGDQVIGLGWRTDREPASAGRRSSPIWGASTWKRARRRGR